MSVGLEALVIFRAKGTIDTRKKYPIICRNDIDKDCDFNPNSNYLYPLSSAEEKKAKSQISPWHCFTLIPEETITEETSLTASLGFMHFLNWAIYYYNILTDTYDSIPKDPKQNEISDAEDWLNIITDMSEKVTDKKYTKAELAEWRKNAFRRNKFVLKPAHFLKLCRFFARAWYEERFSKPGNAVGSVKFAHYASNYIMSNPTQTLSPKCRYYDGNNENHKKEVSRLFGNEKEISYQFRGFDIKIERFNNSNADTKEGTTYTISILQYGCKHDFCLLARLYQYRHISPIVQRLHLNQKMKSIEIKVIPQNKSVEPFYMSVGRYELSKKNDGKYSLIVCGVNAAHSFVDDVEFVQIENKESNVPAEYAETLERFAGTHNLSGILNTLEVS